MDVGDSAEIARQADRLDILINKAGTIASQGGGRVVPYCVSKAALNMLTKLLYFHCKDAGAAIVALHPGWVRTDMGGSGLAELIEIESVENQGTSSVELMVAEVFTNNC